MIAIDVEQRTPEWHALRAGKITASRMNDVMAKLRGGGEAAGRRNYRAQLVCERRTGQVAENGFMSQAMKDGIENEKYARAAYELESDRMVNEVGFVIHPRLEYAGASPDGIVGDNGLLEIKCPVPATHIDYLLNGCVPPEYVNQMAWQMACTGRDWVDFVSWCPPLDDLQFFLIRYQRDQKRIDELEAEAVLFNREVNDIIERLGKLRKGNNATI